MTQTQSNRKIITRNSIIILLSGIGLIVCIVVLFPQVRRMIIDFAIQVLQREPYSYQIWFKTLLGYAIGGICFILFFDYCTLTDSGRTLVQTVKQEIKDSLSEIDFRSFIKPGLIMFGVYLLGTLTIIRANFLYMDDIGRSIEGYRRWYDWSRYVSEIFSIFIHGDTKLTDISPLPQLLAIPMLSVSSVLFVYIIGNGKITLVRLLASIPLGLSPYFLECLSYKFDAPYMALPILASIVPFLFAARKKAFLFCSILSLLIICMTYQAASGIYPMVVLILCFRNWNRREKPDKEIVSFLGTAALAFFFAMLLFRFFFMKSPANHYASTAMHPLPHIVFGTLSNVKNYVMIINHDLGIIWKVGIALVLLFFIFRSMYQSAQKKLLSFFVSVSVFVISFVLSYGMYALLAIPLYLPRAFMGFGVFLAILCIYVVSDYKKIAILSVLALNWCLFVFAFSYGNALADQARYAEFRISILLHDLSVLYPNKGKESMAFQLENSIDYAPSINNIAKHYPVIERLIPRRLGATGNIWNYDYLLGHFNYNPMKAEVEYNSPIDFRSLNLPVVLDSYYHTIRSDGNRILVTLKH